MSYSQSARLIRHELFMQGAYCQVVGYCGYSTGKHGRHTLKVSSCRVGSTHWHAVIHWLTRRWQCLELSDTSVSWTYRWLKNPWHSSEQVINCQVMSYRWLKNSWHICTKCSIANRNTFVSRACANLRVCNVILFYTKYIFFIHKIGNKFEYCTRYRARQPSEQVSSGVNKQREGIESSLNYPGRGRR